MGGELSYLQGQDTSTEIVLIDGHAGAMDVCARGLKAAAAMIEDGGMEDALKARYSGWETRATCWRR